MNNEGKIRVGILRGGSSHTYDTSLKTGGVVLSDLPKEKYKAVDMFIDKEGVWHIQGVPATSSKIASQVDVIFNALQGSYGLDSHVHKTLQELRVPYTGSNFLDSLVGLSRSSTKFHLHQHGIKTPLSHIISAYDTTEHDHLNSYVYEEAQRVFEKISPPWIVKPLHQTEASTVLVTTFPELLRAIESILRQGSGVFVEEYIRGKKASSGVVEKFRNKDVYTLLPTEKNKSQERYTAGEFTQEEKEELQRLAHVAHDVLGLKGYSHTHFIVSPQRGVYVLNVDALPAFDETSSFYQSLQEVGCTSAEFLDHILTLALENNSEDEEEG